MSEASARLALPFIVPGQAQKELYHNEALARIDAALHAAVEAGPMVDPPAESEEGQCWIVAPGAGGAWSGQAMACLLDIRRLRFWSRCRMLVWNKASGHWLHWRGSS
jgi:hypothetical protein